MRCNRNEVTKYIVIKLIGHKKCHYLSIACLHNAVGGLRKLATLLYGVSFCPFFLFTFYLFIYFFTQFQYIILGNFYTPHTLLNYPLTHIIIITFRSDIFQIADKFHYDDGSEELGEDTFMPGTIHCSV